MSDEAPEKSGKVWLYVVGLLVGMPVLYALSVGPAAALNSRGVLPDSAETFYKPLFAVVGITGTQRAYTAYLDFWMTAFGQP